MIRHPFEIPQRLVTAKKSIGADGDLVDIAALKKTPKVLSQHASLIRSYPNVPKHIADNGTDEDVINHLVGHVKDNLLALHDMVPPEVRDRSKRWYDGARKITSKWAEQYGLPDRSIAGVIAAMSPQKDWYQNVSLAQRVLDAHKNFKDFKFSPEMSEEFMNTKSLANYKGLHDFMNGKSMNDIDKSDMSQEEKHMAKAMFIRLHDQTYRSPHYGVVSPEGQEEDHATNDDGSPRRVSWGSLREIGKALQAIEMPEKMSELMGEKHKVRNFYNNIINPNSPNGDVTIDTHAVAAGLMRPLGGNSREVLHNFASFFPGEPRASSSAATGVRGTYPVYAEAYRQAAKERGILPREMQSITWEAARSMFDPAFKRSKKNVKLIDSVWDKYRKGEIEQHEARRRIVNIAGGVKPPTWYTGLGSGPTEAHEAYRYSPDQRTLPQLDAPRETPFVPFKRGGSAIAKSSPSKVIDRALGVLK